MARTRETHRPNVPPPAVEDNNNTDLLPSVAENESKEENFFHDSSNDNEPNIDADMHANTRASTIAVYQRVLTFRLAAATALYDNQQITDADSLRELDDNTIKELCRQINKEGHPISVIAQNSLCFG